MNLTEQQWKIADMVAHGSSAKAISRALSVDGRTVRVRTVETYIHRIADKIGGDGPARQRIIVWYYRRRAA